jgi:hypothetical protein
LNARAVAPVRFVPVITTDVPTGPVAGWSAEIVGTGGTVGDVPVPEVFPPPHEVMVITSAKKMLR